MSCSSTDKNTQLLRQQITANYQALNAELTALEQQVLSLGELGLPALPSGNLFVGSATNVAAAKPITGDVLLDFNGVTSIASGAIVNDDISLTAGIAPGKLALGAGKLLIGGTGSVAAEKDLTGPIGISTEGVTSIATGAITNAQISTTAAIDPQKVALTSGRILIGDVNGRASAQAVSGDVAITTNGTTVTTAITANSIVNLDINDNANIAASKLALASGRILIGDATGKASAQAVDGDVTITSDGTQVTTAIKAGSIVNADINVAAGIATTKLALDTINTKYSYLNGAGSYTIPFGARVVKDEQELRSALTDIANSGQPGTIFINGTITITYFLDLTISGLTIMGFNPSQSKIVLSDTINTVLNTIDGRALNCVIRPERQNITIKGITIQGNNLTPRKNGIESENVRDNSGLTIENCEIKKVYYGITQTGGELSAPNANIRILNNRISNFVGGIYWNWTTFGLDVVGNTVIGDGSEYDKDKASIQNAIWIGNGMTNLHVCNNNVGSVQRMGIEIFWPYWFRTGAVGTQSSSVVSKYKADAGVVITGNTVYDCGSMGISCGGNRNAIVANNSISNVRWIGLELVGDERELARPNRYTNMVVTGNHIYNVNGQPRGLGKAYKPTHSTSSQSIQTHFSSISPVDLNAATVGGTVTFNLPLVGGFRPTLQVGKQFIARDTADIAANSAVVKTLTGKILTYNQITGDVVVTVISKIGSVSVSNWTIFIGRTLVLTLDTTVPMAWGTNAASATSGWVLDANGVPNADAGGQILGASSINLINTVTGGNVDQIGGFVTAYNPAVPAEVTMEITSATGSSITPITTWRACNFATIVAVSIDIIDGVLFANNYINTAVDAVSLKESTLFTPARPESSIPIIENNYGCQVFESHNIYISDNVFTRAGYRYLQVLNSRDVVVENNKFVSPTSSYTNTGTTVTKIATGINAGSIIYDPTDPVTELGDSGTPAANLPNSAVYFFGATKCLLKNNYIKNSTVSNLWYASNGVSLITDAFSRPEVRFGTDLRYRGNISEELDNIIMPINCPVVDLTQEWKTQLAETENFTGYRFHVNPGNARTDSKILAVSTGSAQNIYNWNFASDTSIAIAAGTTSLVFTVKSAQNVYASFFNSWFTTAGGAAAAAALPIGTFVRGEVHNQTTPSGFFEGKVTAFTPGVESFSFTCSVVYNTVTPGTYNLWKFHFDQDALFVSTAGDLVLRKGIQADRTSGTTIATAPTQKLGFWGKTPVVQPVAIAAPTGGDLTSTQAKLNEVLAALRATGIIAT
jgi:hypothetical protein